MSTTQFGLDVQLVTRKVLSKIHSKNAYDYFMKETGGVSPLVEYIPLNKDEISWDELNSFEKLDALSKDEKNLEQALLLNNNEELRNQEYIKNIFIGMVNIYLDELTSSLKVKPVLLSLAFPLSKVADVTKGDGKAYYNMNFSKAFRKIEYVLIRIENL